MEIELKQNDLRRDEAKQKVFERKERKRNKNKNQFRPRVTRIGCHVNGKGEK